jgi:hypothetical protein
MFSPKIAPWVLLVVTVTTFPAKRMDEIFLLAERTFAVTVVDTWLLPVFA